MNTRNIWIQNFLKFIFQMVLYFSNLIEWRDWVGTGKRMFPNARDGKFPVFFGENPVPGKWHSGTQTSISYVRRKDLEDVNYLIVIKSNTYLPWNNKTFESFKILTLPEFVTKWFIHYKMYFNTTSSVQIIFKFFNGKIFFL